MALLKATAPRTFIQMNPYEERIPVFSDQIHYYTGSIVYLGVGDATDSDALYYDIYVANTEVPPSTITPNNSNDWTRIYTTDPAYAAIFTDSDLRAYVDGIQLDYDNKFLDVDSDIAYVLSAFGNVTGYDSDINVLYSKLNSLSQRIINTMDDSLVQHNKTILWDSDAAAFKYVTPALSLNGVLPNSEGDLSYAFTTTRTGTKDELPDSDENGNIFVVVNDSDSEIDGTSYIYSDIGWTRLVGFTDKENDLRYINLSGDTMTGPLLLAREPLSDSEAATKAYVDNLNDSDKQDKIIILDTLSTLYSYTYEEERIYFVKENNTVWIYVDGNLKQFVIPRQRTQDPVLLEAKLDNISVGFFDIEVKTYRFSSFLPGRLKCVRNGTTDEILIILSNISGTGELDGSISNFKLADASTQIFKIRVGSTYSAANNYVLTFISHDGVVSSITMDGANNEVIFSENNRSFNFGEY